MNCIAGAMRHSPNNPVVGPLDDEVSLSFVNSI